MQEGSTEFRTRLEALLAARPDLIPPGATVVVAFSGGPDSLAVLHALGELSTSFGLRIVAGHYDHGVRPGSASEAERVVRQASSFGIRCVVGRSCMPLASDHATLRTARYRWLRVLQREIGAQRIITGHHAEDQAETVLFRIMRGTGVRGLAGIPLRRGSIVRPLLPFRRSDILAYLAAHDLEWIEDPSNTDPRWVRSRIRSRIIPALERDLPDLVPHLVTLSTRAGEADRLMQVHARLVIERAAVPDGRAIDGGRDELVLRRETLLQVSREQRALVVRAAARRLGRSLSSGGTRAGVEFISGGRSGGSVSIGGGLRIAREYERLVIGPRGIGEEPTEIKLPSGSAGRGTIRVLGRKASVRWRHRSVSSLTAGRIAVPVQRGHYPLRFRGWRAGDRIRLPTGTRKLKRLFGDRRIPVGERARLVVLADSTGRVLWVPGLAVAEREPGVEYEDSILELELRDD